MWRRGGIFGILLISLLLRWALVIRGGQYYFSDEHRYEISQEAAGLILQGKVGEAISQLFIAPEHLGFKIMGIIPALVENLIRPSHLIPALFFSLFSVLNLYLIYLLSQRAGAAQVESLLALGIAASCQTLLYYSRHLMPYDAAMTFGLLSLLVALGGEKHAGASLLCGALGFACFITYNGYWILAGFAMLSNFFSGDRRIFAFVRRGILLAAGFLLPLLFLVLGARWAGINLLMKYLEFSGTVDQGLFSEGWSLPFEYLWHAEHFLIVILGALSLLAIFSLFKSNDRRAVWWLAGLLFVYGTLVLFSVYLRSFVVLGRLVRQMMPFLVLLAAHGLVQFDFQKPRSRYATVLVTTLIVVQGLWNYRTSFVLSYPRDFSREAQVQYHDFTFSPKRLLFGAPTVCQNSGYAMENAKYFLTAMETRPTIQGTVLLSRSHPINFLPYQYEGYTPEQRQEFRERNLQMTFYKLDNDTYLTHIKNCLVRE